MEQQVFYTIFVIVAVVFAIAFVSWITSYSSRDEYYDDYYRQRGGYPQPHYPPYYPPHYYPPRSPHFAEWIVMGLVVFVVFAALQYCNRQAERERLDDIIKEQEGEVVVKLKSTPPGNGTGEGEKETDGIKQQTLVIYDEPAPTPSYAPSVRYYYQKYAADDRSRIAEDAEKLEAAFPGRVFIGTVDDGTGYPYKLLIGPYESEEAAKAAHGRHIRVFRHEE